MSRRSFRDELNDARLARLEEKLNEVLRIVEQASTPLLRDASGGIINDCGCPAFNVCHNVACPRAIRITS